MNDFDDVLVAAASGVSETPIQSCIDNSHAPVQHDLTAEDSPSRNGANPDVAHSILDALEKRQGPRGFVACLWESAF